MVRALGTARARWRAHATPVAALVALAVAGPAAAAKGEAPSAHGLRWSEAVVVATGDAHRGPWMMNDSVFEFVDDPTVELLPGGDAAVAWVDQTDKDVVFQRLGRDGEPRSAEPVAVSATPEVFSWLPRLAVAPDDPDTIYALWQEIVFSGGSHGGEAFFARSTDGGRSFGEAVNLSQSEAGDGKGRLTAEYWHNGSLDIAAAAGGVVYAAWTEYEGRLWLARSEDAGQSFAEPIHVAGGPDAAPARGPSLAVGPGGTLHLAWTVGGDPAADIRYTRSTDGARSLAPVRRVAAGDGHADAPKLAVDPRGRLHLAFGVSADGPLGHYAVHYTRMGPDADAFAPPRTLSDPLPGDYASAGYPHLAVAGERRVAISFELFADDARGQPQALGVVISRDGGDGFTQPAEVPGSAAPGFNGSTQGWLMDKIDLRADGTMAVVNSKFDRGERSLIRLRRAATAAPAATDGTRSDR